MLAEQAETGTEETKERLIRCLQRGSKSGERAGIQKGHAPGEARTHNLGIALHVLLYKYRALTDCATGAPLTLPCDGSIRVYSGPVRASAEHAHPRLTARRELAGPRDPAASGPAAPGRAKAARLRKSPSGMAGSSGRAL